MNNKGISLEIAKLKGGQSDEDASLIDDFFTRLDNSHSLYKNQRNQLFKDFIKAFEYYLDNQKSVKETIELLDVKHLGDFYLKRKRENYELDNAAIVYPLGMKFGQMPMFRLSATLKEDVVPEVLQIALYFTIKRFPVFSTVVKTGFFWHYLESSYNLPLVEAEDDIPCKPISIVLRTSRSYRLLYFKKRISVEFFHVLTDGSGGMVFLKTLLYEYFKLLGKEVEIGENILDIDEDVNPEELVNEFTKAEGKDDLNTFFDSKSLQLDGKLAKINPHHILHYQMSLKELREVCKKYGVTITAYILSILFLAAKNNISKKSGEFKIQVPVNMRKFNNSKTLRNYSMYFSASKEINDIPELPVLAKQIDEQLKTRGSEEIMNQMMKTTGKMISMVANIPLIIKNPFIQLAYGYLGNSIIGNALSNIGLVNMPEKMKDYVDYFDFLLIPKAPNRVATTLITYGDKVRFTVIKSSADKKYEKDIYELFQEDGLNIKLEGSIDYES